ncbi:HABP4 protein, partial [Centropus unirufus]|nr:HABP4 protein [Centropus unirufus]
IMQGAARGSAAAEMQKRFGCTVSNRFSQLRDDETDPFDVLREAERRYRQRKKRGEAGAVGRAPSSDGPGKWEFQQEHRQLDAPPTPGVLPQAGQRRAPKQGEKQGLNTQRAEAKQDRTEWRSPSREYRYYERERQMQFSMERPTEKLDREKPPRDYGGGRGGVQGRGRGGRVYGRSSDFDQRGKWDFERQSGSAKIEMEQAASIEETAETEKQPEASAGEPLNKVAEGESMEDLVQEMTLDEWKSRQHQSRPKRELNIQKTEPTVPSKAVVIHKSKYSDLRKGDFEGDSSVRRKRVNDITSQLDINFGSLPRPGCGPRGAQDGHGCGRKVEKGPQPKAVVVLVAPNPDDPEDFPALA